MFLGTAIMMLAGSIVGFANYFLKRSIDAGGSSKVYLMIQLGVTFFVAILLNPVRSGNFSFSPEMASLGLLAGVVLGFMMLSFGKALECGPAGLTSAILNASTVFPILGMVAFFGKDYGFHYTLSNGAGSIILLAGLFWAGYETVHREAFRKWLYLALAACFLHIVFLLILQYRFVLLSFPGESSLFFNLSQREAASEWFMPMTFFSAAVMQVIVYIKQELRPIKKEEIRFGLLGGAFQGVGTFFMIIATEKATALEQAMIFPIFSLMIVLVCNIWGQFLYKEKVHWRAMTVSLFGLLVGALNWSVV